MKVGDRVKMTGGVYDLKSYRIGRWGYPKILATTESVDLTNEFLDMEGTIESVGTHHRVLVRLDSGKKIGAMTGDVHVIPVVYERVTGFPRVEGKL